MRRVVVIGALTMALVALSATTALGAAHFQGAEPDCTVNGSSVDCTGADIAGVGNKNAEATLIVTASQTVNCRTPGGNVVRPHTQTASGSADSGALSPDNGHLTVPPLHADAGPLGPATCPNPGWSAEPVGPVTISYSYTITIGNRVFFRLP